MHRWNTTKRASGTQWPDGELNEALAEHALYSCRHWDERTHLCSIYADRPNMCRNYPYNIGTCSHCGATWDEVKDGIATRES